MKKHDLINRAIKQFVYIAKSNLHYDLTLNIASDTLFCAAMLYLNMKVVV